MKYRGTYQDQFNKSSHASHSGHRSGISVDRGGLGYMSLDDAMELYVFQSLIEQEDDPNLEEKRKFLDQMDEIAVKYLNPKERCIYYLVIHEKKRTADITIILNYNGWRTTQNSIERLFKIMKLYWGFEQINKEDLNEQIDFNFSKLEKKIIKMLQERLTIQQINNKLGKKFHYTKTHGLIKSIFQKLLELDSSCKEYHDFLVEIRRYKDSCNFDEQKDLVKYIEEQGKK